MRVAAFAVVLLIAACSTENRPPFEVTEIEITEPLPGRKMSGGYMTFVNNTESPLTITEVRSPDYGKVEIHRSTIEDGVARMRRIESLEIPAQSRVTLERGGLHLMLMGAKSDADTVRLSFYAGDTFIMEVAAVITRRIN